MFESRRWRARGPRPSPLSPPRWRPPLERLFESAVWKLRREEILDFYATAWLLSHYLLGSPGGRRELSSFAAELERGVPWREAQPAAFGRSTAELQAEVEAHVALLARGVPAESVLDPIGGEPAPPRARTVRGRRWPTSWATWRCA